MRRVRRRKHQTKRSHHVRPSAGLGDEPMAGHGGPHGTLKEFKTRLRAVLACCGRQRRDLRLPSGGKMCQ